MSNNYMYFISLDYTFKYLCLQIMQKIPKGKEWEASQCTFRTKKLSRRKFPPIMQLQFTIVKLKVKIHFKDLVC